jgi:Transposase and inactivated derivatives, IS30 family
MRNLHPSSPERKRHLTMEKRLQIECLYNRNLRLPKKERLSLRRLAAKLGIARSTLSDEIRRGLNPVPNTFKDKDIHDYSASRAQDVVDAGALNKGVPQRYTNHIAALLKELIVKGRLSPNHARSVLVSQGCHPWVPSTSCIYQHIKAGDGGIHRNDTPRPSGKLPKKRAKPVRSKLRPDHLCITDRPPEVGDRAEPGHFEMDTIVSGRGGHGGLLVLIDRCTRFYIIRRLRHLTPDAVLQALRDIVRRKEIRVLKSITTDNGSEFLDDAAIAAILASLNRELKLYYTHAYASWEKGSVENANALVRRWYPKGTDFSRVSHHAIRVLQEVINSIPRRVLDNRTAAQANAAAA